MTENELMEEMKAAQRQKGYLTLEQIDAMTDEQTWIWSYTTCHGCGERIVDPALIPAITKAATSFDDWWERITSKSNHNHKGEG